MRVVLCDGAEKYRTRHEVCFHNSTRGTAGAMLLDEASPGAWLSMLSVALFLSVLNLYVLEHVRGRHGALASWRRVLLVISQSFKRLANGIEPSDKTKDTSSKSSGIFFF